MVSGRRSRNLFDPGRTGPYRLSRSRLESFRRCARCFYLDRRLGVDQVSGPPFLLNSATDTLLKKEFDVYRRDQAPHPLMTAHGVDAVPFQHPDLETWRENFQGVRHLHEATNLLITGAVDDVWVTPAGQLIVVDYKSTCSRQAPTLEGTWKQAYKRQLEVYQWLLRCNGFPVSNTGYFVYVNADTNRDGFHGRLEFNTYLLKHVGSDAWVEGTIRAAHACLMNEAPPRADNECAWCAYREAAQLVGM